jgi:hypothetical protein
VNISKISTELSLRKVDILRVAVLSAPLRQALTFYFGANSPSSTIALGWGEETVLFLQTHFRKYIRLLQPTLEFLFYFVILTCHKVIL